MERGGEGCRDGGWERRTDGARECSGLPLVEQQLRVLLQSLPLQKLPHRLCPIPPASILSTASGPWAGSGSTGRPEGHGCEPVREILPPLLPPATAAAAAAGPGSGRGVSAAGGAVLRFGLAANASGIEWRSTQSDISNPMRRTRAGPHIHAKRACPQDSRDGRAEEVWMMEWR
jgi:hypothetical protein